MKIVQFSSLGKFGGFGNQLFQYCFARAFAEKYNAVLEIPEDWIGRKIFKNIDHQGLSKPIPPCPTIDEIPNLDSYLDKNFKVNLNGYFQFEKAYDFLYYEKIRNWLQFKDEWIEMFPKGGCFYVACHLRRGDYEKYSNIFCTISEESYLESVSFYGYSPLDIIWVSQEKSRINQHCPYDFLPDFFTLMNAPVLFRSNSTFSVWASILGDCITYAPIVEGVIGINKHVYFQYGNWYKTVGDYKGASSRKPGYFIFR